MKPYTVRSNNLANLACLRETAVNIEAELVKELWAGVLEEEFEASALQSGNFEGNSDSFSYNLLLRKTSLTIGYD